MDTIRSSSEHSVHGHVHLYKGNVLPLRELLKEKVDFLESENRDDAFFLVDLAEIDRKLTDWRRRLPRVELFYALKCNNNPEVAKFLADAGVGFDCASKAEIEQILDLGVHPSRIIYANTCKQRGYITFAASRNVDLMTFDDIQELVKIKELFPDARILLRIQTSDRYRAKQSFNKKFGCHVNHSGILLDQARAMKLNVVGVSFHVGTGAEEPDCFATAIAYAHSVFKLGESLGFNMNILDIGGGFPGKDNGSMTFEKVAEVVNVALEKYFPTSHGVRIIAEPGRYVVTTAFTLAVNIIAKKVLFKTTTEAESQKPVPPSSAWSSRYDAINEITKNGEDRENNISKSSDVTSDNKINGESLFNMYYVNDGVFGAFANVIVDTWTIWPEVLHRKSRTTPKTSAERPSVIWGPSCSSLDCLLSECSLPDLDVGEWLYFSNMGAYSLCLACNFNGFGRPLLFFACSQHVWNTVHPRQNGIPDIHQNGISSPGQL